MVEVDRSYEGQKYVDFRKEKLNKSSCCQHLAE
jgi:hypothetical protein